MSLPFPGFNLPYWTIGHIWCIVTLLVAIIILQGHPAGSGMLVIWSATTFVLSIRRLTNSILTKTIEIHGHANGHFHSINLTYSVRPSIPASTIVSSSSTNFDHMQLHLTENDYVVGW
ncbi:hypothetical protein PAXRUDRAFT_836023 [Paxillus rubicundulus Ve08.2h10]|uniref:Uncharacterized protein n=1 Tax=Paxillus rubicundulus Ve08.2h10 TaxID=930991 RepID=A0A0D0BRY7_9AGAM|nr:hypothetical protein PAXRUDRAFT_836023 [Paxillus rubicundulus Ve08.2h10]